MEKNYIINENLAQALINYLGTRPYAEVFQLIAEMQKLKVAEEINDEV